LDADFGV